MSLIIIINSIFISLAHPLSIGLILIIQTILIAIFSGLLINSFWFSYLLVLIFLGGLLILFIYVATLASNEQITINPPQRLTVILFLFLIISFTAFNPSKTFLFNDNIERGITLAWIYSSPFFLISSFLIIYLFIVLIAIVKITKYWAGSLRPI